MKRYVIKELLTLQTRQLKDNEFITPFESNAYNN